MWRGAGGGCQENYFVKISKMGLKRTEKEGETSLKASAAIEVKSTERLSGAAGRGSEKGSDVRTLPRQSGPYLARQELRGPQDQKGKSESGCPGRINVINEKLACMGEEMNLILIMFKIQVDMSGRYWKTKVGLEFKKSGSEIHTWELLYREASKSTTM